MEGRSVKAFFHTVRRLTSVATGGSVRNAAMLWPFDRPWEHG
jgi:hypothetical protein